ncbi:MAG: cytochrome c oxidase assembly protein [Nitratireductor sp.]
MTQQTTSQKNAKLEKGSNTNNSKVALMCLSLVAGMGGLAYASVPLYELFCQVTGYGGTTQTAATMDGIKASDIDMKVRFDANISADLGWDFKPMQREVNIKAGEQAQIAYLATNTSNEPLTGTATFNVTPQSAGAYFNKMECFCFTQTTLKPGESLEMPVVFFVDPEIVLENETRNVRSITLSYTFYPSEPTVQPVANLEKTTPTKSSLN